jgi:hypothetical protein
MIQCKNDEHRQLQAQLSAIKTQVSKLEKFQEKDRSRSCSKPRPALQFLASQEDSI